MRAMVVTPLMERWGKLVFGLTIRSPKELMLKIILIFVPVYGIAFFTKSMVYVLPTLAVFLLFGSGIYAKNEDDGVNSKDDGQADSSD